ncbi:hypothetical protein G9P44_005823 [Scheffersomyces stipitis]|nr:hypothetical protein G9P44_005823 [Scheffersomyces stipitis]
MSSDNIIQMQRPPLPTQQQSQSHLQQKQISPTPVKRTARDYQFGTRIGEGSYSTVFSAMDIHNSKTYAIKVLSKRHIVKEDKIKYVNIEKITLHRLGQQHPGIVQLYYTFQDEKSLFFVLDFAEYGELLSIIRKFGSLSEAVSKFYMCQIVDAVKFIHSKGVIHRDLKPENILVAHDFSLKITDFGAAKLLGNSDDNDEKIDYNSVDEAQNVPVKVSDEDRKGSFVGTAEYVSPELLKHNICGFEADVWALGCILYQFFHGVPPFKGNTEYLTFEKIINIDYSYRSKYPLPPDVIEIIDKILLADPQQRSTIPQIQKSRWFQDVPWDDLNFIWHRKVPRFEPFGPGSNNAPSPVMSTFKTGSNRNMNKSNSYQQLHSQIQHSDFAYIPSVGVKKSYQPATRIKKNIVAPQQLGPPAQILQQTQQQPPPPAPLVPPISPTHPAFVSAPSPPRTQNQHHAHAYRAQMLQQPNMTLPPSQQQQQPQQSRSADSRNIAMNTSLSVDSTPKISPPPQASDSPSKSPHYTNLRTNTAFAMTNSTSSSDSNNQSSDGQLASGSSSGSASSSRNVSSSKHKSQPQPPAIPNSLVSAAAAAAAGSGMKQAQRSAPTLPSAKLAIATKSKEDLKQKTTKTKIIEAKNTIKFKEISNLLSPNEKILKMDTILKSELSNKILKRQPAEQLDDSLIDDLITKYSRQLEKNAEVVVTVITNLARVFFVTASLGVMLVDLKANNGGDYSMYDYEFESLAVDDDGNDSEEVYGYLILELIRKGGDLIFLKRISDFERLSLEDSVKVVDRSGDQVKLGKNYGWIDCLLMAKDMVSREKSSPAVRKEKSPTPTSSPSLSSKSSSVPTAASKKKPTKTTAVPKKPKKSTVQTNTGRSSSTTTNKTIIAQPTAAKPMSKFAYAAAAAAHK